MNRSITLEAIPGAPRNDLRRVPARARQTVLAIGAAGRVPALALLQMRLAMASLTIDLGGGYDRMLNNALWLLVLANSTATLSAACRARTGRWTSDR